MWWELQERVTPEQQRYYTSSNANMVIARSWQEAGPCVGGRVGCCENKVVCAGQVRKLTKKRWACHMSIRDEMNIVVGEIKLHHTFSYLYPQFPINYSGHIGDYYYVTATVEYGCVDI